MDMFLFAVRISNGNMHQQLKYDASSNELVGNNSYLLEALNAYESPRKLFSPTFELLDGPPGALPLLSFYTGTRDLMTYSANGGKKQKPTTTTAASTSSKHPLIVSSTRTRKKRPFPEGFIMHDALEQFALSDEESVKTTRTHRRNISDISFRSTFSESSDAMAMKVVDEGITSWVFNTFCTITQGFLERNAPPTDGYVVRYTIHPVSYQTETAFGTFRAKSDGAAMPHGWNPTHGYARDNDEKLEKLFLIEAKASSAAEAEAQQFAQCLSFMAARIVYLKRLGHGFHSMAGLDSWLWDVYILCINQTKCELKYVRFTLPYLQLVLGDDQTITGGLALRDFQIQLRHCGGLQTYSPLDRRTIVEMLNALCTKRRAEVIRLKNFKRVD